VGRSEFGCWREWFRRTSKFPPDPFAAEVAYGVRPTATAFGRVELFSFCLCFDAAPKGPLLHDGALAGVVPILTESKSPLLPKAGRSGAPAGSVPIEQTTQRKSRWVGHPHRGDGPWNRNQRLISKVDKQRRKVKVPSSQERGEVGARGLKYDGVHPFKTGEVRWA
jgi:hypothetical protein